MITSRLYYSVALCMELLPYDKDNPAKMKVVSDNVDISVKYAEMLIATLKRAGLVGTKRGCKGGVYVEDPGTLNMDQVMMAVEPPKYYMPKHKNTEKLLTTYCLKSEIEAEKILLDSYL